MTTGRARSSERTTFRGVLDVDRHRSDSSARSCGEWSQAINPRPESASGASSDPAAQNRPASHGQPAPAALAPLAALELPTVA